MIKNLHFTRRLTIAVLAIFMLSPGWGLAATTYTWIATSGSASWATDASWSPTRTTPAADDILQFSAGGDVTATNVPSQTIGGLIISGGTVVTLNSSGVAITLTINNGVSGADLSVASGCQLKIAQVTNSNPFIITISPGATGSITGSMDFSSATATTINQITAADAAGLTFNSGAVFTQNTNSTGNVFGSTGTPNTIIFANGSTFFHNAGSNPFGLAQPSSKVVFQTGSLYKLVGSTGASYSGRIYANFEYAKTGTESASGAAAISIDNLTVSSGILNINMTGTLGHSIKGNISVATGATLNFAPADPGGTVNLNGASVQTISGAGTITSGAFSTLVVNNSAGAVLDANAALIGNLTVTAGSLTINPTRQLTVSGTLTNNAGTSGLVVKSGGSLIANNSVAASIKRSFLGASYFQLLYLPVSGGMGSTSPFFDGAYLDRYVESDGAWTRLVNSDPVESIKGYSINYASPTELTFTGSIFTGDQTFSSLGYTSAATGYGPGAGTY